MDSARFSRKLKVFGLTALAGLLFGFVLLIASSSITRKPILVLLVPLAGCVLIPIILNFQWMMLFLMGTRSSLDPILNFTKAGGGAGLGALLNLLVIALVGSMCVRYRSIFSGRRFWWSSWALFIATASIAAFFSPLPTQAIRLIINFLTYVLVFVSPLFLIHEKGGEKRWFKWLLLTSLLPVLIADVGLVTHHRLLYDGGRLNGSFSHANILGFFLVYVLALMLYIWKTRVVPLTLPLKFCVVVHGLNILALLVFTQARSAWISCALLFLLYGLLRDKRMTITCLLLGALLSVTPPVQDRLKDLTEGTGVRRTDKLNSFVWRVKLWENSLVEIKKHWLSGRGLGSFQYLSPEFGGLHRKETAPAHNIYVELLFETGIFGLIAYLSIFVRILKRLWIRMRARSPDGDGAAILFVYLLGYLFVSFSDNTLYYLAMNWYLWFFAGLVLASDPQRTDYVVKVERA